MNNWNLIAGTVSRSVPGVYTYEVACDDGVLRNCVISDRVGRSAAGATSIEPIEAGTEVLIAVCGANRSPVIVGALSPRTADTKSFSPAFETRPEGAAGYTTQDTWVKQGNNKERVARELNQLGRPLDILPGDRVLQSAGGAMLALQGLIAEIRGGGASVSVNALDDILRMTSQLYQHFSAIGSSQIFNDGGNCSVEMNLVARQPELYGERAYTSPFAARTENDRTTDDCRQDSTKVEREQEMKRRMAVLGGALGDLAQLFITSPGPAPHKPDTRDPQEAGLMRAHISDSGHLSLESANGFTMFRTHRIPVPARTHRPWDPEGDKPEDGEMEEKPHEPFQFQEDAPGGRHLQARDDVHWRRRQSYRRVDEHKKDFETPEDADTPLPRNNYDPLLNSTEKFQEHVKVESLFTTTDDGGYILRDAWGSEIRMHGGNIYLTPLLNLVQQPGKSSITMAGDDFVVRAKNSADISATEHDVRIKANRNLHFYSKDGGLLFETESSGGHGWADGAVGEYVGSKGITFKAPKGDIYSWGERIITSSTGQTIIHGTGTILTEGKNIDTISTGKIQLITERGLLSLSGGSYTMMAESSTMATSGGMDFLSQDRKTPILIWVGDGEPQVTPQLDNLEEQLEPYRDPEFKWLQPYDREMRDLIKFTYRNSDQMGTSLPFEAGEPEFRLYQSWPQYLLQAGHPMPGVASSDSWDEIEINETKPWPGKEKFDASSWWALDQERNVENHIGATRKDRKPQGGNITGKPFTSYTISK